MCCPTAVSVEAPDRSRTRITSRTTHDGDEVLVVEVPDASPMVDADLLVRLLLETTTQLPAAMPVARRVHVDDELFDLALDELMTWPRHDSAVLLQSASRLAGIRSLPEEDARHAGRAMRRLHRALSAHA